MAPEGLLDKRQVGKLLGLHPRTVTNKATAGELPAVRVGNKWMFRPSEIDEYLSAQRSQPKPAESHGGAPALN